MDKITLERYIKTNAKATVEFYADDLREHNLFDMAVKTAEKEKQGLVNEHKQKLIKAFKEGDAETFVNTLLG